MRLSFLVFPVVSLACGALAGCSVVAPDPVWELAKATAGLAGMAMSAAPGKSSDTIRHFDGGTGAGAVCILFNPDTQVPDIVPALQAELRQHRIDSRVYDRQMPAQICGVWLKYAAQIGWEQPPFSGEYRPFVRQAALSLRSAGGEVLSSSHYQLDGGFAQGKWATTREKLAPVVTALLTGVETGPASASASASRTNPQESQ